MAKSSIGIIEVAKRCNTSIASVSYAFSHRRPVSIKTRSKILEVAKEMGYKPDMLASSFRRGKTDIIGLLIDTLNSPFFAYWANCLEQAAREKGHRVWLANTEGDAELAKSYLAEFKSMRICGVVVSTSAVCDNQIRELCADGWTVVTRNRNVAGVSTSPVEIDFAAGIEQSVDYLFSLGHRKMGFIAGPVDDPTSMSRLAAFKRCTQQRGIMADESHIVYGKEGIGVGADEAKRLLDNVHDLTAIISSCDTMAFAAMHAIASMGLQVPQDISIVGYDDIPYAKLWHPSLTTVSTNIPEIARIVIECVISENSQELCANKRVITPKLIVRETCGKAKEKK